MIQYNACNFELFMNFFQTLSLSPSFKYIKKNQNLYSDANINVPDTGA